ncbi:kinase-like domain-containing protein [Mycena galericulata]|nr:kinase-like domain-containing protein [Mycena galericulata]
MPSTIKARCLVRSRVCSTHPASARPTPLYSPVPRWLQALRITVLSNCPRRDSPPYCCCARGKREVSQKGNSLHYHCGVYPCLRYYLRMSPCLYDSLLTLIILACWCFILHTLSANMKWEKVCDARNLAEHCSKYVIPKDQFTDVELLTSGNALVVSRATYQGQPVVLKRWHAALVEDRHRVQFAKRLIRELDRWRTLAPHPNIAPVLGVALHISNLPALVVPHHRTVMQILADDPATDVLHLMQGIAAGLNYLHNHEPPITHGDLKGSTVLVSPSGAALLSDIGIAAIPQPPDWTFRGVDDARWLAPEVMDVELRPQPEGQGGSRDVDAESKRERGSEWERTPFGTLPVTPESDIYSFGMLAYQMHTRARPFASTVWAASVVLQVVAQRRRPPRPPQAQSPQLTDAGWALIECCWKHDWRERRACLFLLSLSSSFQLGYLLSL